MESEYFWPFRSRTFAWDLARVEDVVLDVEHMTIVGCHYRHNGYLRLHRQMECALFEWQQHRLLGVAPRALGEKKHTLLQGLHLVGSALHSLARILGILAVDED